MKKFFSSKWKILFVAFVIGFLFSELLFPNINSSLFKSSLVDYDNMENIDDAIVAYHVKANEITNEFIEILLSEEDPNVAFVEDPADCDSANVSTYCLAVKLNDELVALEAYLQGRVGDLAEDPDGDKDLDNLEEMAVASAEQENKIEEELIAAEDSLDMLLNVYNQIQLVYPIHREFGVLVDSLNGFNEGLMKVRNEIEKYPATFNDVTMVECK